MMNPQYEEYKKLKGEDPILEILRRHLPINDPSIPRSHSITDVDFAQLQFTVHGFNSAAWELVDKRIFNRFQGDETGIRHEVKRIFTRIYSRL